MSVVKAGQKRRRCNLHVSPGWQMREMNAINPVVDHMTRILVVDDDPGIRTLISGFLERHGYHVDTAEHAARMRTLLEQSAYDLIVLDVMMPGEDGLSVLRRMDREGGPPIIMLSAVGTDVDRIIGLELGAEDYLPKPCNPRELLARIRTVLRRRAPAEEENARLAPAEPADGGDTMLRFAGWRLDLVSRLLHDPDDIVISLSDGEFRLLRAFVERPRRVLTRDQLLDYARGADSDHYDRTIDVQISRLRRKLGPAEGSGALIRTVRNEGYMFVPKVSAG
jgi:two-component system OmpR family response regulator